MIIFSECEQFGTRKLENNTWLVKIDDDTYGVKLYDTVVVEVRRDGGYRLFTGGYKTTTTKDRINKYGPKTVRQNKKTWFIDNVEFEEGILV
jgi:hypothetical protein